MGHRQHLNLYLQKKTELQRQVEVRAAQLKACVLELQPQVEVPAQLKVKFNPFKTQAEVQAVVTQVVVMEIKVVVPQAVVVATQVGQVRVEGNLVLGNQVAVPQAVVVAPQVGQVRVEGNLVLGNQVVATRLVERQDGEDATWRARRADHLML